MDYLKNNPKDYWFRPKPFGWGWAPATWQGFTVTLTFMGYLILLGIGLSKSEPTILELKYFFVKVILAVVILILIAFLTGEKPHWQWGFKEKK